MRMLGIYPTEKALVTEVLPEMQGDEPSGLIPYARFEAKVLDMLQKRYVLCVHIVVYVYVRIDWVG